MSFKVLLVGNYKDGASGWSEGIQNYILAMDSVGINVVPRAIRFNNIPAEVPPRILELENNDIKKPDVVIQFVPPHVMDYNGKIGKNIGMCYLESSNFKSNPWAKFLNTMDENWVCCAHNRQCMEDSGVSTPIKTIHQPINTSKFLKDYKPLLDKDNNHFIFYTIGEPNKRKNFPALIKAFHLEFAPNEPVELLIKTYPNKELPMLVDEIKRGMKLYGNISYYKQERIITSYLTKDEIMGLHASCDCFISPSFGESVSLTTMDALGMGKPVITSRWSGFLSYLNDDNAWLVDGRIEPIFGYVDTYADLFTSRENWFSIDQLALQRAMRECYENEKLRRQKAENGMRTIMENHNYKKIGSQINEILS